MPKDVFEKHDSGITIGDAILIYKRMIEDPKYRGVSHGSAAYKRMKELQILYNSGLRYFPKKKRNK